MSKMEGEIAKTALLCRFSLKLRLQFFAEINNTSYVCAQCPESVS